MASVAPHRFALRHLHDNTLLCIALRGLYDFAPLCLFCIVCIALCIAWCCMELRCITLLCFTSGRCRLLPAKLHGIVALHRITSHATASVLRHSLGLLTVIVFACFRPCICALCSESIGQHRIASHHLHHNSSLELHGIVYYNQHRIALHLFALNGVACCCATLHCFALHRFA